MDQAEKIRRLDSSRDRLRAKEKDAERLKVEENVFDVSPLYHFQ